MANKNTAGNMLVRTKAREDRLIDKIDRRDGNGKNMENTYTKYNNYRVEDSGERVWSF